MVASIVLASFILLSYKSSDYKIQFFFWNERKIDFLFFFYTVR